MLQYLTGQVAWITGAGIGEADTGAIKLAEAGCKVVLSGRRAEPLAAVRATIEAAGGEVMVEPLDVSSNEDVLAVVGRIKERFGHIDIGVFSAGINVKDRNWPVVSTEGWDQVSALTSTAPSTAATPCSRPCVSRAVA
jgi:NAD(P)-dependent dehydrogenase (short-subunit alcohol dehydrogenase family)